VKAKATVRLKFPSEKHLEMIAKALAPETEKPATFRSRVRMEKDGEFLVLKAKASDTVALRAALNAYLRWINSAANVLETLENIS
jgi:tRNA threonylcarbamoyladenosine modification (KEOPS) complex  Pcc1 subunit